MSTATLALNVGRAFYGRFKQLRLAQSGAVAPVLAGLDALVLAGTGSGKTEAVLAPMVQRLLPVMRKAEGCTIVYVTPTRALANDLMRRIEQPLGALGLRAGVRHGERNDLDRREKPNVLVTTPESLDVLIGTGNKALQGVRGIIIDEIHLTYNTQRGLQLAVLLKRAEAFAGHAIQVAGLSATVATPSDIWQFFRPGTTPVTVKDDQAKPLDSVIRCLSSPRALVALIDDIGSRPRAKILVFVNARRECDRLAAALRTSTSFGENVFAHHSSLDGGARIAVEKKFQEASKAVCIATSTLELGIDIGDIDLVMLYGHPGSWESFLQRIGRGNRRSNKTNVACLVSPDHGPTFRSILAFKALLSQIASGRLERERPLEIYGAVVQQICSVISENRTSFRRANDLVELFSGWSHLDRTLIERLLRELARSGHLKPHEFQNRYGAGEALHRLGDLRLLWGNFPTRSRDIRLTVGSRQLGTVPATNITQLSPGSIVRFGGRYWCVRRVLWDRIEVDPSPNTAGVEIKYGGTGVSLDPTIAEEMLRVIETANDDGVLPADAGHEFAAKLHRIRSHVSWERLPVASDSRGYHHYVTFGGRTLNDVVARWARLASYEADDIVLRTNQAVDFSSLPTDPSQLVDLASSALQAPGELTIFQNLLPQEILKRELQDVWLKRAVYRRSLERLRQARLSPAPFVDLVPLLPASG